MTDITNCRMFLLERFYYELFHHLKKENGKLAKDEIFEDFEGNHKIKTSFFNYCYDTPNYKIIRETIYDHKRKEKRFITYKIDYKNLTERHIHKADRGFVYLDLKYFFKYINGKLELMRVNQYYSKGMIDCHIFRDVNGLKVSKPVYIQEGRINKALKMTREELYQYSKPRKLFPKYDS